MFLAATISAAACAAIASPLFAAYGNDSESLDGCTAATCVAVDVNPGGGSAQERFVQLLERLRASAGCTPLKQLGSLGKAADVQARDMVRHGLVGHGGSDGSQPRARANSAGFHGEVVELIAVGVQDPESALAMISTGLAGRDAAAQVIDCTWTSVGLSQLSERVRSDFGPGVWVVLLGRG